MSPRGDGRVGGPEGDDEASPSATAVVLAGGRSVRFGRDKLAEQVGGRPLLEHAISAVARVAREIVVVVAPESVPPCCPATAGRGVPVRIVHDARAGEGPLEGLRAGLAEARESLVIVVGGDMPDLVPDVLGALLRALADALDHDAAALGLGGHRQPLPLALRRSAAREVVEALVDGGERRLGGVLDRLAVRVLEAEEWSSLDPRAATLRDIDRPEDLGSS